jgi:CBS domain-containing protein/sporulation protein YlmC with PRC-barrel domain
MLYFSELAGKRVVTDNGTALGKLTDLIFLAENQPVITKLVVSGHTETPYLIPVSYITRLNSIITVADSFTIEPLAQNELYVNKNVLDQQIIDIKGNKIVRVNDVVIQDKPVLIVAGVDIGIVGILRWFGADETFGRLLRILGKTVTSQFLSWAEIQPLQLSRGRVVLKIEEKKLAKLRPEDLADHLETLSVRNATRVLDIMDENLAAQVVENLNISYQQYLFKQFTPQRSAKLIEPMDADEAVDILLSLTDKRRLNIMSHLSPAKQIEINELMALSTTPIGGMITNKFFTARPEETAGKIRGRVRSETDDYNGIFYVYAVNAGRQLVGVVNLHELLMAAADTPLYRFMNPSLIVLHLTTPVKIAARRMLKYQIEGLPVIDDNKHILGVVSINELSEWILEKI